MLNYWRYFEDINVEKEKKRCYENIICVCVCVCVYVYNILYYYIIIFYFIIFKTKLFFN